MLLYIYITFVVLPFHVVTVSYKRKLVFSFCRITVLIGLAFMGLQHCGI